MDELEMLVFIIHFFKKMAKLQLNWASNFQHNWSNGFGGGQSSLSFYPNRYVIINKNESEYGLVYFLYVIMFRNIHTVFLLT